MPSHELDAINNRLKNGISCRELPKHRLLRIEAEPASGTGGLRLSSGFLSPWLAAGCHLNAATLADILLVIHNSGLVPAIALG
jgi:hypothetical protein